MMYYLFLKKLENQRRYLITCASLYIAVVELLPPYRSQSDAVPLFWKFHGNISNGSAGVIMLTWTLLKTVSASETLVLYCAVLYWLYFTVLYIVHVWMHRFCDSCVRLWFVSSIRSFRCFYILCSTTYFDGIMPVLVTFLLLKLQCIFCMIVVLLLFLCCGQSEYSVRRGIVWTLESCC